MAEDVNAAVRDRLKAFIDSGAELVGRKINYADEFNLRLLEAEAKHWVKDVSAFVVESYGNGDERSLWRGKPAPNVNDALYASVQNRQRQIAAIIPDLLVLSKRPPVRRAATQPPPGAIVDATKVFIVHGHDESALEWVKGFVREVGLTPAVLREQPSGGKTLMEKVAHYAPQMAYALVILTPDDVGYKAIHGDDKARRQAQPRSRQNVIFEWGYLMGLLGRDKVCALHHGNIEMPSDLHGVVYESFDDRGAWKIKVAGELRHVGIAADFTNITVR
jgi:predicted nucleotide-binding protein